ncbi:MAG: bifunctional metallophosphatase/5'-nucleotidase [Mangrovibacterium sp.]
MSNRRTFLKQAFAASAGLALATVPQKLMAKKNHAKLTILHTNDIHSHITPFTEGTLEGKGGLARLSSMINKVRKEEENVMLLDSGDMFQGTPFFNNFKGELIFKIMSQMGYQASTLGNHEFDNGVERLVKSMRYAKFPIINSNYDFSATPFEGEFIPFQTFFQKGIKVGVYGLGVDPHGLVDPINYKDIIYNDPIEVAQRMERILKEDQKCDVVICLSHLGFEYTIKGQENKISDKILAPHTQYTDLILGGHTHTYLKEPFYAINADGKSILINQTGWGGLHLGRIDIYFDRIGGEVAYVGASSLENKA